MSGTPQGNYKEHALFYDEEKNEWYTLIDGDRHCAASLKDLKNYIDKSIRKEFKPIPVIRTDGTVGKDRFEFSTIVSVTPKGDVYLRNKYGSREKLRWGSVYLDNPKNRKLVKEYAALHKLIDATEKKADKVEDQLEKFDKDALVKDING